MINDQNEIVIVVDQNDNIIDNVTRQKMRENKHIHRQSNIFIFDKHGQLYVQKRSSNKRYCPNFWDPYFGGLCNQNETYDDTAYRELFEETGLQNKDLQFQFKIYFESERTKAWQQIYICEHNEELKKQDLEIELIQKMRIQDIIDRKNRGENFTPDGWQAFNQLLQNLPLKFFQKFEM